MSDFQVLGFRTVQVTILLSLWELDLWGYGSRTNETRHSSCLGDMGRKGCKNRMLVEGFNLSYHNMETILFIDP